MVNTNDEQRRMGEIIVALNAQLGLAPVVQPFDDWKKAMVGEIDRFIRTDFSRLVSILYRLDINEQKLERLLKENTGEDAAAIITNLIIERQVEKILSREKFREDEKDISDEERW